MPTLANCDFPALDTSLLGSAEYPGIEHSAGVESVNHMPLSLSERAGSDQIRVSRHREYGRGVSRKGHSAASLRFPRCRWRSQKTNRRLSNANTDLDRAFDCRGCYYTRPVGKGNSCEYPFYPPSLRI